MIDIADIPLIDSVYREFFNTPYPNRSSIAAKALVVPGMRVEIVAYAVPSHCPPLT
ncbi:Rid family hydrolase [Pandoraea terrigena]|uniref:Endoribonuclease L-PSP n=1 Tax=Pandoraea terrigena TaxID=2508292 RepID=A0A5E4T4E4_9BURK|nr:endoribonuclease L-PSP [Pandoraea terrigena]